MLAVYVDFGIDPESLDAFSLSIQWSASDSLENEVDCNQFDITQDRQNPSKIFLYELCDDAVAFELHKNASHYLEFNDAISGLFDKKSARSLRKINH